MVNFNTSALGSQCQSTKPIFVPNFGFTNRLKQLESCLSLAESFFAQNARCQMSTVKKEKRLGRLRLKYSEEGGKAKRCVQ